MTPLTEGIGKKNSTTVPAWLLPKLLSVDLNIEHTIDSLYCLKIVRKINQQKEIKRASWNSFVSQSYPVIVLCILTDKIIVAPMTMFIGAKRLHFIVNSEHMSFNLPRPCPSLLQI
jgi:hypothetical protein